MNDHHHHTSRDPSALPRMRKSLSNNIHMENQVLYSQLESAFKNNSSNLNLPARFNSSQNLSVSVPSAAAGSSENHPHGAHMLSPGAAPNIAVSAPFSYKRKGSQGSLASDDSEQETVIGSANPSSSNPAFRRLHSSAASIASVRTADMSAGSHTNGNTTRLFLATTPRRSSVSSSSDDVKPARLVYVTNLGGKANFILRNKETTIGRKEDNDIVLTCAKISKYHAVITRHEGGYLIWDKGSSNGVRVNDTLIQPNKSFSLIAGDVILIGSITLKFYDYTSQGLNGPYADPLENHPVNLVTILPSEAKYNETVTIRAEIDAKDEIDFMSVANVNDVSTLREDYERLRLAYEVSKLSVTLDLNELFDKVLDMIFSLIPVDRGVVLLFDNHTNMLATQFVKLRPGKGFENREILVSSTIVKKVYYERTCLVTSDACEDPTLGKAESIKVGQIRSVLCVPLISHNKVHGILHLDARDKINSFASKNVGIVKAISNQTALAIENSMLLREVEAKARMTEQLGRFLAPAVVERMSSRQDLIKKGGRDVRGTIVFADIRGFTNISERSEPSEVVALLNDYFERLVKIVFKHKGVIDKFIGDALMAHFGTLEDDKDSEYRAVAAGLEFLVAIQDMNDERKRQSKEPIEIGVGINTGPLLAGFIGASQRLEYTCIGDTVNTSSRICGMAPANQVLISDSTYEVVKNRIQVNKVGAKVFKGKSKEVMVYEVVCLTDASKRLRTSVQFIEDRTIKNKTGNW